MTRPSSSFDGATGRLAAKVMARRNHGAELEAVEILAPRPTDTLLAEPRRWRARSEGGRSVAFEVTRVGRP